MIGFYSYTMVSTYMELAGVTLGMTLTVQGFARCTLFCLAFSGLCDILGGRVAHTRLNRTEDEKRFGIQIDSLRDVVCPGAFPMILYCSMGMGGVAGACILVFCSTAGATRLAFFSMMEEHRQDETDEARKYYQGLPTTSISIILPLFCTLRSLLGHRSLSELHIYILAVGLLPIINFQLRKPGWKLLSFFVALAAVVLAKIYSSQRSLSMVPLSLYQSKERCGSTKYTDRSGHIHGRESTQGELLRTLYNSSPGCLIPRPLIHPCMSRIGEYLPDSPLSTFLIKPFVRSSGASLRGCEAPASGTYRSSNVFFIRSLKGTARPFNQDSDILCSPCDGLVSAYPISREQHLSIKHTDYTMLQLLRDDKLASRCMGGTALVFCLTVSDYHRCAYTNSGLRSSY